MVPARGPSKGILTLATGVPWVQANGISGFKSQTAGDRFYWPLSDFNFDPFSGGEGSMFAVVVPDFAGNDGVLHYLFDIFDTDSSKTINVKKRATNKLSLGCIDNVGGNHSNEWPGMNWTANEPITIGAYWDSSYCRIIFNGSFNSMLGPTITGDISGAPAPSFKFYLGTDESGAFTGDMVIEHFMWFLHSYTDPLWWKNIHNRFIRRK